MKKTEVNAIFENIVSGCARETYDANGWTEKAFNEVLTLEK